MLPYINVIHDTFLNVTKLPLDHQSKKMDLPLPFFEDFRVG